MAGQIKRLWLHDEDNTFKIIPITTLDSIKIQEDQNQESFTSFEEDYNRLKNLIDYNRTLANNSYTNLDNRVTVLEAGGGGGTTALATTTSHGLMSKEDKIKLNGISENANNYILPKASASALGGIKVDGTTFTVDSNGVLHINGGAGSASSMEDLTDVSIGSSLANGDVLMYNEVSEKWENVTREYLINETMNYVSFSKIVELFDTTEYNYDLSIINS